MRHFWLSTKGLVREKELYKEIKKTLTNKETIKNFVEELKVESETYKELIEPTSMFWDKKMFEYVKTVNILDLKQVLPLMLTGYHCLDKKEARTLFCLLTDLTFRYSTICGKNPNILERIFSEVSIKIRQKEFNLGEAKKKILELNPQNQEFLDSFSNKEIKKEKVARFILDKIEKKMRQSEEVEVKSDPMEVNLEHIIPKRPGKDWKAYFKDNEIIHQECLNKIGNLTLLGGKKNKEGSNKLFCEKKKIFSGSDIIITKNLCEYGNWDRETISHRQEQFAEIANKIWKL